MAKSERQKLKLLYLRDYLRQNTDEAHPADVQELIDYLASKDIHAERKSIYDDIRTLNDYGTDILYRRGKPSGYYVAQRDFAPAELKLLVDAVLSSKFLTQKQSATLIRKLAALSTTQGSELLRRQIVLSGRLKSSNEKSYANIDLLHEAIGADSQITFRYFDRGVDKQKHFRAGIYTASPCALVWDDENYYLVAHGSRHGLTHYRVDKMENIQLTGQKRVMTEEMRNFNPASYAKEVFGMYRGSSKRVKLRFENALAGVVFDRFGEDTMLIPDGEGHFTITASISVSPNFLAWVASFGGRATIVFPKSAVEEYRTLLKKSLAALPEEAERMR